jgi:hypothetical protein
MQGEHQAVRFDFLPVFQIPLGLGSTNLFYFPLVIIACDLKV